MIVTNAPCSFQQLKKNLTVVQQHEIRSRRLLGQGKDDPKERCIHQQFRRSACGVPGDVVQKEERTRCVLRRRRCRQRFEVVQRGAAEDHRTAAPRGLFYLGYIVVYISRDVLAGYSGRVPDAFTVFDGVDEKTER